MQRESGYYSKFPPEVMLEAHRVLASKLPNQKEPLVPCQMGHRKVTLPGESWDHDNDALFFQHYRDPKCSTALYYVWSLATKHSLKISFNQDTTWVAVQASEEATIAEVFEVFDRVAAQHQIERPKPKPPLAPKIFIGHGGKSKEWMDLQNHLRDHHHYQTEAFESGSRSGHAIRDVLDNLVRSSTFAIIVFTAEDDMPDGSKRARENVVHETGLFQGRLGFHRAIVLLEKGIDLFSNLDGIQYVSFSKGNIRESYGDVLATVRREFGDAR
jgi:predicted nucleotide-binding protein